MSDVLTHRYVGPIDGSTHGKPGLKTWGVSMLALAMLAGGVVIGPRLLTHPAQHAPSAPPGVGFKDGDIVHKGDLLFQIDPTPYQIRVSQTAAALVAARARLELATREAWRAHTLAQTNAGSAQAADQRDTDARAAQAAVDQAEAQVRDALF